MSIFEAKLLQPMLRSMAITTTKGRYLSSFTVDKLAKLWDETSGTKEISELKGRVSRASQAFDEATAKVTLSRRHLDRTMAQFDQVSAKHAAILRNRDQWTPDDAQQFARIVQEEIEARKELGLARNELAQAESNLSQRQLEYVDAMRQRYHEEQIWQDKWRVLGTFGTWSLIVLNSFVFLASQFFHQKREKMRLTSIETLINQKIPTSLTPTDGKYEETHQNAVEIMTDQEISKGNEPSSTNDANVDRQGAQVDAESKSVNEGNDHHMDDVNKRRADDFSARHTVPGNNDHGILSSDFFRLRSNIQALIGPRNGESIENAWKSSQTKISNVTAQTISAVQQVHVPSAIIGATVTGITFTIAIMLSKR